MPTIAAKLPFAQKWNTPIDSGRSFRGKRILGNNKTWRGLLSGIIAGIATSYLLHFIYIQQKDALAPLMPIAYEEINPFVFGLLSSLGALCGDAVESFAKRQINIPPGSSWFPFDQIDYIIGGIIFTAWYAPLTPYLYLLAVCVAFLEHIVVSYIGYIVGLKKKPI